MNLFFSSFAMRTAKAKPIPEEQPVISTTFWFIVSCKWFVLQLHQQRMQEDNKGEVVGGGSFKTYSLIHRSATQQKPCAHGLEITIKQDLRI